MQTIDVAKCYDLLRTKPMRKRRRLEGPFDYGDQESANCCVKSVDSSAVEQFGLFIGNVESVGYTIVIYDLGNVPLGGQVFETIAEMHQHWQVD